MTVLVVGSVALDSVEGRGTTVRVTLPREVVYSIVAYLKRHRRETSPRAIRFELEPGRIPRIVLEPWELPINTHGCAPYAGPPTPPIRSSFPPAGSTRREHFIA